MVALGLLMAFAFSAGLLAAPDSAHGLRNQLAGLGVWGPLAMIATYALLTCAMVPGPVLAGASGLLFGTALGTLIATVSATLGATAAFLIARGLAQRPYAALVTGRLRDWTQRIENYSSPQALAGIGVLVVMSLGGALLLWRTRRGRVAG